MEQLPAFLEREKAIDKYYRENLEKINLATHYGAPNSFGED